MQSATFVRTRQQFGGTFECRRCELEVPAVVHASGWGGRELVVDTDGVEHEQHEADLDANAVASRTLTFVKCPRCGSVDPSALSYRIQVILGALALGLLAAGVTFVFSHFSRRGKALADASGIGWLYVIITLVVAGVLYARWRRPWARVRQRVILDLSGVELGARR